MSETMFNILYQSHSGSWFILVLLVVISYIFSRQKITPMILRLFYLIMLISGIGMLYAMDFPGKFILKGILAIALIAVSEMLLGRKKRRQPHAILWVVWVVILVVVALLGFDVL